MKFEDTLKDDHEVPGTNGDEHLVAVPEATWDAMTEGAFPKGLGPTPMAFRSPSQSWTCRIAKRPKTGSIRTSSDVVISRRIRRACCADDATTARKSLQQNLAPSAAQALDKMSKAYLARPRSSLPSTASPSAQFAAMATSLGP